MFFILPLNSHLVELIIGVFISLFAIAFLLCILELVVAYIDTVLQYYYLMSIIADVCIYLLIINENTILLFNFELFNLSCLLICICDDAF